MPSHYSIENWITTLPPISNEEIKGNLPTLFDLEKTCEKDVVSNSGQRNCSICSRDSIAKQPHHDVISEQQSLSLNLFGYSQLNPAPKLYSCITWLFVR